MQLRFTEGWVLVCLKSYIKEAMAIELKLNGLKVEKNVKIPVEYKGKPIGIIL